MTITTIGRWINLPTPSGASDPLRADESLDAGTLQILSSNVTHAARENNLRALYEYAGTDALYNGLPGDAPENFPWDFGSSSGRVVLFAGTHRVRLYGETSTPPKLRVKLRGLAISTYTLGVLVVAMPAPGRPVLRGGNYVHLTTTTPAAPTHTHAGSLRTRSPCARRLPASSRRGLCTSRAGWTRRTTRKTRATRSKTASR
jgi:hypothetical protein